MLEHGRAILGDVFVEQDAGVGIAQQPRERGLAVEKGAIAQILAIVLDQVEGVEIGGMRGHTAGPHLKQIPNVPPIYCLATKWRIAWPSPLQCM